MCDFDDIPRYGVRLPIPPYPFSDSLVREAAALLPFFLSGRRGPNAPLPLENPRR